MERPETRPVPPLSEELVKDLQERFPNRWPQLAETDREIWFKAGQRSVVEFLSKAHERQIERRFNHVHEHP